MSFAIRPAMEADIPFIIKNYLYVVRNNPMQTKRQLTAAKIRSDVLAPNPKAFIDVATFDGEVTAFIMYSFVYYASTGQNIWVTIMFVDPFAQRPGLSSVGKRLVDNIAEKHPDVGGIYAVTERGNHAMQSVTARYGGQIYEHFLFIGGLVNEDRP